jgi:hypothetical protein
MTATQFITEWGSIFLAKAQCRSKRNMIAGRHCFFYWSPEIPPAQLGYQAPLWLH